MVSQPVLSKRSYCRICTNQCGIVAEVAGDRLLKVRGDFDHPLSKGYTCPKGRAIGRLHHHPDALTRPMLRRGGALVPASWDECLDDLAARLKRVVDEHGPNAVAVYFGSGLGMDASGYRLADMFYTALGREGQAPPPKFSPLTIDGTAKVMVACTMGGLRPLLNKCTARAAAGSSAAQSVRCASATRGAFAAPRAAAARLPRNGRSSTSLACALRWSTSKNSGSAPS